MLTRTAYANPIYWTVLGIGVGILTAGITAANPVADATGKALNELPFAAVRGATSAQESTLVSLWAQFGLDQPILYNRATRDLIDTNFSKLKKYMLNCQTPGRGLDYGIQARFRSQGDAADREAMCRNLREWLKVADVVIDQSLDILASPGLMAKRRGAARARAADMLADWGDSASLKALISNKSLPPQSKGAAQASLDRLRHPADHGFIFPDGHGGILFTRDRSDLVSMTLHQAHATAECPDTVEASRTDELWDLLHRSRESKHADWFNDGYGLHLVFKDGLVVELKPTESGWIEYSDSIRGLFRGRIVLEAPALYDAIKECLPARALLR